MEQRAEIFLAQKNRPCVINRIWIFQPKQNGLLNQNSSFDDIYSSLTNSALYVAHTFKRNQGWQKQTLKLGGGGWERGQFMKDETLTRFIKNSLNIKGDKDGEGSNPVTMEDKKLGFHCSGWLYKDVQIGIIMSWKYKSAILKLFSAY